MCKQAQIDKQARKKLSKLDFRFHFFPWYREPTYRIGSSLSITSEVQEYFDHLLLLGIILDDQQKAWYVGRQSTQKDDMKREFPSTPDESWEVTNEGLYYSKQMNIARAEKRISFIPYDDTIPVYTAWDLGYNDANSIWIFQVYGKEIRLLEYLEGSNESMAYWIGIIKSKEYVYEKHIAPHDIMVHEYTSGITRQTTARNLNVNFLPAQKVEKIVGIDAVRSILNRCWFDEVKCHKGIRSLENYKKEWDDRNACWRSQPLHNWASHGADAFRTLATGLHYITNQRSPLDIQQDQIRQQEYLRTRYQVNR